MCSGSKGRNEKAHPVPQNILSHRFVGKHQNISHLCTHNGGLAQLARALAWHARGHRFDSDILHRQEVIGSTAAAGRSDILHKTRLTIPLSGFLLNEIYILLPWYELPVTFTISITLFRCYSLCPTLPSKAISKPPLIPRDNWRRWVQKHCQLR